MSDDEEEDQEFFERSEALDFARVEAIRDLIEADDVISYVAYCPHFEDYFFCEFHSAGPQGWVQTRRFLNASERRSNEQLTDEHIRDIAKRGKMLVAVALYRAEHSVGLLEAKTAVERMLAKP